jgi:hypothetical protein
MYVTFEIAPDGAHPSCLVVTLQQRLRLFNNANGFPGAPSCTATVTVARFSTRTVAPGQTTTFDAPFSSYLANGEYVRCW